MKIMTNLVLQLNTLDQLTPIDFAEDFKDLMTSCTCTQQLNKHVLVQSQHANDSIRFQGHSSHKNVQTKIQDF